MNTNLYFIRFPSLATIFSFSTNLQKLWQTLIQIILTILRYSSSAKTTFDMLLSISFSFLNIALIFSSWAAPILNASTIETLWAHFISAAFLANLILLTIPKNPLFSSFWITSFALLFPYFLHVTYCSSVKVRSVISGSIWFWIINLA